MRLVHYQTLEAVAQKELQVLNRIKNHFNEGRNFMERVKLWPKSYILDGMEPRGARWGFSRLRNDEDRSRLLSVLRSMSRATPRLTWILYDERNGGEEILLRGGKRLS